MPGRADGSVSIRPATLDDAVGLARVHTVGWRQGYDGLLGADYLARREVPADHWRAILGGLDARAAVLVADRGGPIVGFAFAGPQELVAEPGAPADAHMATLYALYVLAELWGTGVGYRLYQAAMAAVIAAGFREATLWVLEGNERAIRFYERQGWTDDHLSRTEDTDGEVLLEHRYRLRLPVGPAAPGVTLGPSTGT